MRTKGGVGSDNAVSPGRASSIAWSGRAGVVGTAKAGNEMKQLSVVLALAGVAAAAVLVVWFDAGAVLQAIAGVGIGGVALLLAWGVLTMAMLAAAWAWALPGPSYAVLLRGRAVRDAATTCLPFSPVGGYVLGARALTIQGVRWPLAAAGTVIDVGAEIFAQLLFALFGLAVLLWRLPDAALARPIGLGIATVVIGAAVVVALRGPIGRGLRSVGARLLGAWFGAADGFAAMPDELARLGTHRVRLSVAVAIHLSGWFITGVGTWISLRLLGWHGDVVPILALEALLDAVIAAAFIVPGAAGVQEAGYVALGTIFGVGPELALSVSLLRRGRDLLIGAPVLALWHWAELRRLRA